MHTGKIDLNCIRMNLAVDAFCYASNDKKKKLKENYEIIHGFVKIKIKIPCFFRVPTNLV